MSKSAYTGPFIRLLSIKRAPKRLGVGFLEDDMNDFREDYRSEGGGRGRIESLRRLRLRRRRSGTRSTNLLPGIRGQARSFVVFHISSQMSG